MKEEIDNINKCFKEFFSSKNYVEEKNVMISSNIDRSVTFIGSAISVLKPILLNENIDENGNFIVQRAIRTRPLKRINISEKIEWSSYFDALGVLVNYNKLEVLINNVIDFLNYEMNIPLNDILFRVSTRDLDLIRAIKNIDCGIKLEFDTRALDYYSHKYGLQDYGIYGRNFNIAIKDPQFKDYKDIGNIIIIENQEHKFGVEFAVGINAIIMRKKGLETSINASSISDIVRLDSNSKYKFADCVSVVSHLAYENVERLSKDKKYRSSIYLYRKYLRALKEWASILNISNKELLNIIENYLLLEYNNFNSQTLLYNLKLN